MTHSKLFDFTQPVFVAVYTIVSNVYNRYHFQPKLEYSHVLHKDASFSDCGPIRL